MQKTDLIEFFLMLISSAEKTICRKTDIIEFCLRFISSDVEKHISLMFV